MANRTVFLRVAACGAAVVLTGCARMPKETLVYRQPGASPAIVVTQTLGCSPGDDAIIEKAEVKAVAAYGASDITTSVDLHLFIHRAGKQSVEFTLRDNGTLSGINATGEGQGVAIAKSVVSLASVLGRGTNFAYERGKTATPCATLRAFAKAKAGTPAIVTVTYSVPVKLERKPTAAGRADQGFVVSPTDDVPKDDTNWHNQGDPFLVPVDAAGVTAKLALQPLLGTFEVKAEAPHVENIALANPEEAKCNAAEPGQSGFVRLPLRRTADVTLTVVHERNDSKARTFTENITVPVDGCYGVQVPIARAFGTNEFQLGLAENGRITHIKYAAGGGLSDVASVLGSVTDLKSTDATRAKAAQDKADVLFEEHRLMTCTLDITQCTR
ncbi:hypothetical protein FIV34_12155 [Luteibacter pinisoli]|uniref:Lipoprotein n=1 Tax=Luteibacter pinisoli TaxID=2589080 RepID=A0A4Y5Z3P2_9GAMM|nr:hypothetical protein [Luteibacter pinisoli]QDE39911.1 hypothetical protein FIV34_12155 [Luteibacter pinisoli]